MEMTLLDAFRQFNKRNSDLVGSTTLFSLRPRNVKIASPHETCMCIYHENMQLLLQVRTFVILSSVEILYSYNRYGTGTINKYGKNPSLEQPKSSLRKTSSVE